MSERHLVFVYGSLLRGLGNHGHLVGARYVRRATTAPGFVMRDLGAFPAVSARDGAGCVVGEVYEVDALGLRRLDRLEGHPGFYRREWIRLADGTAAETYLIDEGCPRRADWLAVSEIVASGDWRAHREERDRAWRSRGVGATRPRWTR